MKLKPYLKYKDSGIQWIGEIPEEWEVKKVKHFSISIAGGTPDTTNTAFWDGKIPWLPSGRVHDKSIHENEVTTFITLEGLSKSSAKWIKKDSVLVALTGATCANIGYLTFRATANQSVIGIQPNRKTNSKYVFYYLLSQREQILLHQTGGAQAGINKEDIVNLFCAFPQKIEQEAITSFLDSKTSKIDQTIEKDKELIELLKEKRTALINHVVTKGLDPKAKMKDSGIDWIGDIPDGWEVKKLKFFANEKKNKVKDAENKKYIGLEHIESETGKLKKYGNSNDVDGDTLTFTENNVLFGKLRPYLVKVVITQDRGVCSTEIIVYEAKEVLPLFLKYRLISKGYIDYVNSLTYGVKMPRADPTTLSNIKLPVPPKKEQFQIVEYLDKETSKIDQTINKIQEKFNLREEYKTSLIHHVVTGKVDVKEAVA